MKIKISNFKRLIGIWKTTGKISVGNETRKLNGTDCYEFILDGNYILHKADVLMGNENNETFEIITLGNTADIARMQYFNSKGESGIMTSEINNNGFKIEGNGLKFSGTINDKNSEIVGNWYLQTENNDWVPFIELKLEKQN